MLVPFALASLLVSSAYALPTARSTPTCNRQYTVVAGDTCDKISAAHGVSTWQLAFANPAVNAGCTNLQLDQVLCLGWGVEDCTTTHVVKAQEYCYGIASQYNIDLSLLYANNGQVDTQDCKNLYTGEVLCVANSAFKYTYRGEAGSTSPATTPPATGTTTPSTIPPATGSKSVGDSPDTPDTADSPDSPDSPDGTPENPENPEEPELDEDDDNDGDYYEGDEDEDC